MYWLIKIIDKYKINYAVVRQMKNRLIIVVTIFLSAVACAYPGHEQEIPVTWWEGEFLPEFMGTTPSEHGQFSELYTRIWKVGVYFDEPVVIEYDGGASKKPLTKCEDFEGVGKIYDSDLKSESFHLQEWRVSCSFLKVAAKMKPSKRSYFPSELSSYINELASVKFESKYENEVLSWLTTPVLVNCDSKSSCFVRNANDVAISLDVFSRGDFDYDGTEDVTIYVKYWYGDYSTRPTIFGIVLSKPNKSASVRLLDVF